MKHILEVKNISKKYLIRHENVSYLKFSDAMLAKLKPGKSTTEDFMALDDVSFNVEKGDTIGIIGNNGAGKSTLLKILSKITPPTSGKIISRGRIASLLEVGTGFHGELSGKENVFLNGAILGMKRFEIKNKFDQIVEFSGTEKFIDTPLKHYSSGMQLRLAFAVAAFLEPEILIIDEVLAVGDQDFQRKCLKKIEEVSTQEGRTILMVSHDMAALRKVCKKCVLIEKGKIKMEGEMKDVIARYINFDQIRQPHVSFPDKGGKAHISEISLGTKGSVSTQFHFDEKVEFHFVIKNKPDSKAYFLGFSLKNSQSIRLFTLKENLNPEKDECNVTLSLPSSTLVPDNYSILVSLIGRNNEILEYKEDCLSFLILETGSPLQEYRNSNYGLIYLKDYVYKVE